MLVDLVETALAESGYFVRNPNLEFKDVDGERQCEMSFLGLKENYVGGGRVSHGRVTIFLDQVNDNDAEALVIELINKLDTYAFLIGSVERAASLGLFEVFTFTVEASGVSN